MCRRPKRSEYVSPDGSVFLPAGRVFQQGPPDYTGLALLRQPGHLWLHQRPARQRVYVSSESEDVTYSALVPGRDAWRAEALCRNAAARVSPSMTKATCRWRTERFSSTVHRANRLALFVCLSARLTLCLAAPATARCSFSATIHCLRQRYEIRRSLSDDYAERIDLVTFICDSSQCSLTQCFPVSVTWRVTMTADDLLTYLNSNQPAIRLFITRNFYAICFHA